ncbi:MAG: hypothetical protein RXR08_03560 [Sulfolobaceae archaeon]|jgi:hypothetical protein|uniref:Uncharacterized protein n=3 Tax=Sulfolobaceae TaxID=118883 RepID=H2C2I8_9CREN|nr:hypothetical protein LD85_1564 [Sulfolobus islandicus L.D.8.5]EHP70459.1 hypothetical protein MetMK1DRAFT_00009610 [Metallosphaera yellowstonensis MK1]
MEKKQIKIIEPETEEVTVINNSEELHNLFEELKKESDIIHRKRIPS